MDNANSRRFIVLFSGESSLKWTRILSRDFKHVIILIEHNNNWKFINPMRKGIVSTLIRSSDQLNIAKTYSGMGYKVVMGYVNERQSVKFRKLNCVNVCKKALGINEWKVQTPKQLFKYLIKNKIGTEVIS